MKASITKHQFETGLKQPKTGLSKNRYYYYHSGQIAHIRTIVWSIQILCIHRNRLPPPARSTILSSSLSSSFP